MTFSSTGNALPSGVTLSASGLLSGIPDAGMGGVYNLTFQASNGVAPNASQSFTLTVNQAPAFTSANATSFTIGNAGNFNVTANGFPSPNITLMSGSLPSGVNFTPGTGTATLGGTPDVGTGGMYSLVFAADNGVARPFPQKGRPHAVDVGPTQSFTLTVIVPVCTPPPANMIGWWPADNNPSDIQGGNDVSFQGSVTYGPGKVAQAFTFNGSDYATAGNPAALNLTGNKVTIDGWVNPSVAMSTEAVFFGKFGNGAIQYILEWIPGGGGTLAGRINNGSTEAVFTPPTGAWTHLALVYDGAATPSVKVYVNGVVLVATSSATGNINSTTSPFLIGGTPDGRNFNGLVDEVEVFDRALGATEIGNIYNASIAGKCRPALATQLGGLAQNTRRCGNL